MVELGFELILTPEPEGTRKGQKEEGERKGKKGGESLHTEYSSGIVF